MSEDFKVYVKLISSTLLFVVLGVLVGGAKRRARLPDSASACAAPGRRLTLGPIFARLDLIESGVWKRPDFLRHRKSFI